MIRAIAFDCFGVLLNDYGHNWVDTAGLSSEVQARVHELFRQRDLGRLDGDEYYEEVGNAAGVDPAVLKAKEHSVGLLDPMILSYIKTELASKYSLYIASNASSGLLSELLSRDGFEGIFENVFVSSELGVIKPDPLFYGKMLAQISIPPEEILFVDDREPNVAAAVKAGMQGYHYANGFAEFRQYLNSL